jgi:hypothetical protein
VGATDAGPMQIQLREGVSLRCAETVLGRNPRRGTSRELPRKKEYRPDCGGRGRKKGSVWPQDRRIVSAPKRVEFSRWGGAIGWVTAFSKSATGKTGVSFDV